MEVRWFSIGTSTSFKRKEKDHHGKTNILLIVALNIYNTTLR
jgi:hypothetical protein